MTLDPERFPRASAYLRSLPDGWNSYPECQARAETGRMAVLDFPQLLERGVEPAIRERIQRAVTSEEWIPDVMGTALRLMVRDVALTTDQAFLTWNFDLAMKVFSSPVYRMLMFVLSPSLVLMGGARRWGTFRRGTTLVPDGDKTSARLAVTYPRGLYPELMARALGEAFRASLTAARAQSVRLDLTAHSDTAARWTAAWK
ncbi:MAG: hypothetical protein HY904_13060 [Deltaproteobacteria bacterium]|nr:hypothetical protein [Deltaproteobacteria bacterium]